MHVQLAGLHPFTEQMDAFVFPSFLSFTRLKLPVDFLFECCSNGAASRRLSFFVGLVTGAVAFRQGGMGHVLSGI